MLYHGPVRVPAAARPGKAIVRVEFPEGSSYRSIATDIEVDWSCRSRSETHHDELLATDEQLVRRVLRAGGRVPLRRCHNRSGRPNVPESE